MKGGRERKKERNLDARDGTEQKNRLKQSTESGRKKTKKKEEERKDVGENKEKRRKKEREIGREDGTRKGGMRRSSNSNTSKPSALISSQFRSLETRTEVVVA